MKKSNDPSVKNDLPQSIREIPFSPASEKFVKDHLALGKHDLWFTFLGCWLISAWLLAFAVPIFRLFDDSRASITLLALSVLLAGFLLIAMLGSWIVARVRLHLDLRFKKTIAYRGKIDIVRAPRKEGGTEEFPTYWIKLIDLELSSYTPWFGKSEMEVPLETHSRWEEKLNGELELLYYSQIPYRFNGKLVPQYGCYPFRVSTRLLLFVGWQVAMLISAFCLPGWWALGVSVVSFMVLGWFLKLPEPTTDPFWPEDFDSDHSGTHHIVGR